MEVTESILAGARAGAALEELHQLGVRFAIDDFGTGYSSLTTLRQYPFDTLRVDRSFVAGIETTTDDQAIVLATLAMSRALGLRTVAEGVETAGQLRMLAGFECDEAQGYLLGRPGPPEAIDALLQRDTPVSLGLSEPGVPGNSIAESAAVLPRWRIGEPTGFGPKLAPSDQRLRVFTISSASGAAEAGFWPV